MARAAPSAPTSSRPLDTSPDVAHVVRGGQLDRPVLEPDGMRRRRADALSLPDVEPDMVVIAAGRHECSRAKVELQLETEHVAIELERIGDVADVEVHVADAETVA